MQQFYNVVHNYMWLIFHMFNNYFCRSLQWQKYFDGENLTNKTCYVYSLPIVATVPPHPLGAHVEVHELSTLTSSHPECPVLPSACLPGLSLDLALHPAGRCGLPLIPSDGEGRRMIRKGDEEVNRFSMSLCTYQCYIPSTPVRGRSGMGGDLMAELLKCPTLGTSSKINSKDVQGMPIFIMHMHSSNSPL